MILFVSGATRTVARLVEAGACPHLGQMLRPGNGNGPGALPWCVDNGAFTGFDPVAFRSLLARLRGASGCVFVAAPDVVADGAATLRMFPPWARELRAQGWPVALVTQDGMCSRALPWDALDAVFVGGSTAWKLGPESARICAEARARGRWVHVGRVNSLRRMRAARAMGADSIDGTAFSKWPDTYLPRALRDLGRLDRQRSLFHAAP